MDNTLNLAYGLDRKCFLSLDNGKCWPPSVTIATIPPKSLPMVRIS